MSMEYNYPSILCKYCPYTEYGLQACETVTPISGYVSCEGSFCEEAYDNYVEETGDNTPLEELF